MKIMSATDVRNKTGDAWSFSEKESLLIEKNGKGSYMAFAAPIAKRMVLASYQSGVLSRSDAMNLLGISWYGDLLEALSQEKISRPLTPAKERAYMVENAIKVLGSP